MELRNINLEETSFLSERAYFCIFLYLQFTSCLLKKEAHLLREISD